jgi:hypothetical protein
MERSLRPMRRGRGSAAAPSWLPGLFVDHILDVDGDRLVIDAFHFPDTSEEELAAQRAVLESIQLAPTP